MLLFKFLYGTIGVLAILWILFGVHLALHFSTLISKQFGINDNITNYSRDPDLRKTVHDALKLNSTPIHIVSPISVRLPRIVSIIIACTGFAVTQRATLTLQLKEVKRVCDWNQVTCEIILPFFASKRGDFVYSLRQLQGPLEAISESVSSVRTFPIQNVNEISYFLAGIELASSPYILYLNTRSIPRNKNNQNWLVGMIREFELDDKVSIVGPQLLLSNSTTYSAGMDAYFSSDFSPRLYHRYQGIHESQSNFLESNTVAAVLKEGMMIRRDILKKMQPPETNNFHIELCMQMLQTKNLIKFSPSALFSIGFPEKNELEKTNNIVPKKILSAWIEQGLLIHNMTIVWEFPEVGKKGECHESTIEASELIEALQDKVDQRVATGKLICASYSAKRTRILRQVLAKSKTDNKISKESERSLVWITEKPCDQYPRFPYHDSSIQQWIEPDYLIGRSASDTSLIPESWIPKCNSDAVDEIWVPSHFSLESFKSSQVKSEKLIVVPRGVDTQLFDPGHIEPHQLLIPLIKEKRFIFLSAFPWIYQKGPELLIEAYFQEFSKNESVSLVLVTHSETNTGITYSTSLIRDNVLKVAKRLGKKEHELPHFFVISQVMTGDEMAKVYKASNAFVLPTMGEAFGRELAEAMAMELPTIATNFSGHLDFMTPNNSFLIELAGYENVRKTAKTLVTAEQVQPFEVIRAKPSISHLRELMRYLYGNRDLTKLVGKQARLDIIRQLSKEKVLQRILSELERVKQKLATSSHRTSKLSLTTG